MRRAGACAVASAFLSLLIGACSAEAAAPRIVGIAFVDSSVTAMGSRGRLPPGAIIYPSGTRITGTTGCTTNRYGTDGLIVAVIDYDGRPTAASVQVTRHPAEGGEFQNAPYYLDLNPGRTVQFLGPFNDNGQYDLEMVSSFSGPMADKTHGSFTLARSCPMVQ